MPSWHNLFGWIRFKSPTLTIIIVFSSGKVIYGFAVVPSLCVVSFRGRILPRRYITAFGSN
jgi:hypothetical protein